MAHVAVGIIGTSETTALLLSQICGAAWPQSHSCLPPTFTSPFLEHKAFRTYFEPQTRTLYVQLAVPLDFVDLQVAQSVECTDDISAKLRSAVWDSRLDFLKAALHLFLSCHLMVWAEPKPCAASLRHLQVLQVAKQTVNLQEVVPPALAGIASGAEKEQPPQLLFAINRHEPLLAADAFKKVDTQMREIFRLMAQEQSGAPLFYVASDQPCALLIPDTEEYLQSVMAAGLRALDAASPLQPVPQPEGAQQFRDLREVVMATIKSIRQKTPGLSTLAEWTPAARHLCELLGLGAQDMSSAAAEPEQTDGHTQQRAGPLAKALTALQARQDPTGRVSALNCKRAVAEGLKAYTRGLPARYTQAAHQASLQRALRTFRALARGPYVTRSAAELRQRCEEAWRSGKELCSAVSLSGRPCTVAPEKHRAEERGPETEEDGVSDAGGHSSGLVYLLADAAGVSRHQVPDAFSLASVNARDWETHAAVGTQSLPMHVSPVGAKGSRSGSTAPKRAAKWAFLTVHDSQKRTDVGSWAQGFEEGHGQLAPLALPRPPAAAAIKAPQPLEAAEQLEGGALNLDLEFPPLLAASEATQRGGRAGASGGGDTKRKEEVDLAYMELVRSGWPGFSGADMAAAQDHPPVEKEEPSQKARSRRGGRQPGRGRRLVERPPADSKPREVMHIGFEYECPQGRRCFLTAHMLPGFQASKTPPGQQAASLLGANLPLWVDLPARSGSQRSGGAWGAPVNADAQPAAAGEACERGQLMRIWVGTPPAPLAFSLQPVIQFQAGGQIFKFQLEAQQELAPNRLSVLCLPLFYAIPAAWKAKKPGQGGDQERTPASDLPGSETASAQRGWRVLGGLGRENEEARLLGGTAVRPL